MRKRVIALRFGSPQEAAEFLSLVSERVGDQVIVEQSGSSVKLIIPPSSDDARGVYTKLLSLIRQWKLSRQSPRGGVYRHSVALLLSAAKLRVGIPVSAVAELLQLKGFRTKFEGGFLETDAGFEAAVKAAEELSKRYAEALDLKAAPLVRRLAAVLAAAYGRPVDEVIEALEGTGLVREDEGGRLLLAVNYADALRKARSLLSAA